MPRERIAVIGATGAVGLELLQQLAARGVPAEHIVPLASKQSAGHTLAYRELHDDRSLVVRELTEDSLENVGLALFAASAEVSRRFVPLALQAGATVIDNSSAFRLDHEVPLVIPEVNGHLLDARPRLVANPNCSTIILLVALEGLRRAFGVRSIIVSTYQAVSGAGAAGIDELVSQSTHVLAGGEPQPRHFREPCAFNVFSHDSAIDPESGMNVEERKIIDESRKIWSTCASESRESPPAPDITPTCIRVPVLRAHSQSILVELTRPAHESEVRAALGCAAGIAVIDDRASNRFPTPLLASHKDDVLVGRIRSDPSETPTNAGFRHWCLFACGDQLRKGAATNALQIAERLGVLPEHAPSPARTFAVTNR